LKVIEKKCVELLTKRLFRLKNEEKVEVILKQKNMKVEFKHSPMLAYEIQYIILYLIYLVWIGKIIRRKENGRTMTE
jgi:hypothetical protein